MTWSPTAHQITPFLHVPDLQQAVALFVDTLGFELVHSESNYVYLEFGGAGLRVLEERGRRLQLDGKARMAVYVDVPDVDALYAWLQPRLAQLPITDVEPPRDKTWRQREFSVRLPDRDWLTFGQPVRP
ncbi:MAG: VOC family protein [Gemmatimonadota bacterium]|nr:VOC family protein [Gemmatimonadota bacterium]MDH5197380.1 VOC family protein [Gemmatimonadota bacterium]